MAILRTDADGLALTDNSGNVLVKTTGSVLQVVQGTTQTQTTLTNINYFTATNLFASITPSSSSNKILVFVNINASTASDHVVTTVYRGGTNLGDSDWGFANHFLTGQNNIPPGSGAVSNQQKHCFQFLDSPGTTSSVTYRVYARQRFGSSIGADVATRGLNVITLMEIRG